MADENQYDILRGHLAEQGRTEAEIETIMDKLVEYDRKMMSDSVFESIDVGTFDLEAFVKKVLDEEEPPAADEDS